MPSCWQEAISAVWIGVTGHYKLTYEDRAYEAGEKLTRLMEQLDSRESELQKTLQRASDETVALRLDRPKCKAKLMAYKRTSMQMRRLQEYKDTVEMHMDALHNTELNKSLITTLQESSKALKELGIEDGVQQAEMVITSVHESMRSVSELTNALGKPMQLSALDTVTDDELDAELDEMLGLKPAEAEPALTVPPAVQQTMRREEAVRIEQLHAD